MGILDRLRSGRSAGMMYSGKRDVYGANGYVPVGAENYDTYQGLYERDPIAGAIVDVPVQDSWSAAPEVIEPDHPKGTSFTQAVEKVNRAVGLWRTLSNLDAQAGVGRFAILL